MASPPAHCPRRPALRRWARAAEAALGLHLNAFLVSDLHDARLMQELVRRAFAGGPGGRFVLCCAALCCLRSALLCSAVVCRRPSVLCCAGAPNGGAWACLGTSLLL